MLTPDFLAAVYRGTHVLRKPTYGIVSGYHELPYVCLGEDREHGSGTLDVRGKVLVSPRFVLRPSHYQERYGDIFGEEHLDHEIAGRVFGFLGFRGRPVECTSEHLTVRHVEGPVDQLVDQVADEMDRMEDITTGLLVTPDSRYFPVSIERFIASVLEDEFGG
jgi:hypothetical protein